MIPLYSSEQVRKADNYAIKNLKIPSIALMENASRSIFQIVQSKFPELNRTHKIGIVCGKGNNGGDGFALARHFINDGYNVIVISLSNGNGLTTDSSINYKVLKALIKEYPNSSLVTYSSLNDLKKLSSCYMVFDAMLGTGAKGELREPYKKIVKNLNRLNGYRIAIDIPTGLDLDNSCGELIFDADLTITLAEFKTGLFYGRGYNYSGQVEKGYIGIGSEYFSGLEVSNYLIEPEDAFIGLPLKQIDSHKYSSGKVLSVAGSGKLPGAAVYTANTAILSGAGASILAFPESIVGIAQIKLDSSVVHSYGDDGFEYLQQNSVPELQSMFDWADCVAIGPGLGREIETVNAVRDILKSRVKKRTVIDADALYAISNKYYKKLNLQGMVLTPHHAEFANLIGIELSKLKCNLLNFGKKFAQETKAYLVLKGAPTIIFTPTGEALINTTGNPGMATFGSGDVLTGMIASFIAQHPNLEEALISAVYLHSLSADLLLESLTELGITADSIMRNIPSTIKFLEDSFVKATV